MSQEEEAPKETAEAQPEETPLGPSGEKALKAERQARKAAEKQLQELQDRIKSFEDRDKSDLERLTEQAQQAQAEAAKAQAELLRLRVAADSGLPADLIEFLGTGDEESLRAQAEKLLAATARAEEPRSPAPDPSQGAKPGNTGPTQLGRDDLARMSPADIEEARVAGRLDDILSGRA